MFDRAWLDAVSIHRPRPLLFMAEAVLMYFEEAQVKRLVLTLRERFPGAELVCDAATPLMVRLDNLHLVLTPVRARVHWGLAHGQDLETWGEGIRLLEEWFYSTSCATCSRAISTATPGTSLVAPPKPSLSIALKMRLFPFLATVIGVYRYRI